MRSARRQVRERLFSSTFLRTHRYSAANVFLKVLTIVFVVFPNHDSCARSLATASRQRLKQA
jgi:hypothetical protein